MVDVRVTKLNTEVLQEVDAPVRVTRAQVESVYTDRTLPVRLTRLQAAAVYQDKTYPVRVSFLAVQSMFSVEQTISLPVRISRLTVQTLMKVDREPVTPIRPPLPNRELNPYQPKLLAAGGGASGAATQVDLDALAEHVDRQTKLIREQHNVTQAGDTTAPWEFLAKIGKDRQFTLGSLGRFYHDDFGIIIARYCQFSKMRTPEWLNGPCGRLSKSNVIDWKVTNDLTLSSADDVVGVIATYTVPKEGDFGWIIVEGANIVSLLLDQSTPIVANQTQLVWSGFETVATVGKGRVLGRNVGKLNIVSNYQYQLDAGQVYIKIEGPSIDSIAQGVVGQVGDLQAQIAKINETLTQLDLDNVGADLDKLTEQVAGLNVRLIRNDQQDNANDAAVQKQLVELSRALAGFVTTKVFNDSQMEQDNRINGAERAIGMVAGQVDVLVSLNLAVTIADLYRQIANISTTKLIPLVDGGIPPSLVYLPSGKLVFLEIKL